MKQFVKYSSCLSERKKETESKAMIKLIYNCMVYILWHEKEIIKKKKQKFVFFKFWSINNGIPSLETEMKFRNNLSCCP